MFELAYLKIRVLIDIHGIFLSFPSIKSINFIQVTIVYILSVRRGLLFLELPHKIIITHLNILVIDVGLGKNQFTVNKAISYEKSENKKKEESIRRH